jgi:soluble lytic murein transglycosylase-like protein
LPPEERQEIFAMTTHSLSTIPSFGGRIRPPHSGRTQAIIVALIAVLAMALLPTSTPGGAIATTAASTVASAAPSNPATDVIPVGRSQRRTSAARDIEALTNVVARKYRVSHDATRELVDAAYREGARYGLDPILIIAVMAVESRFNPIAASDGGAVGLMQVIPRYHSDKLDPATGETMLDPHTNIKVGAGVLKEYIRRGGSPTAGLQLYNGASGDASNAYANRVLSEMQSLQHAVRRPGNGA